MSHGGVWFDLLYIYVDVHVSTPKAYEASEAFHCTIRACIICGERVTLYEMLARGSKIVRRKKRVRCLEAVELQCAEHVGV